MSKEVKKIKFVLSPSCKPFNLGYSIGDVVSIEAKQADELIDAGFAVPVNKKGEVEQKTDPDFKALFEAEKAKSAGLQKDLDAANAEIETLKAAAITVKDAENAADKAVQAAEKR